MQFALFFILFILIYNNWKEINKIEYIFPSLIIGLPGGIINSISMSYLNNTQFLIINIIFSGIFMSAILAVSLFLAKRAELPLLWPNIKTRPKWILFCIGIIGGVFLGGINLMLTMSWLEKSATVPMIFKQISFSTNPLLLSALLSIQAGIVEEIIFRTFIIPAAYLTIMRLFPKTNKKVILAFSVLISALAFGLIPSHNLFLGTLFGAFLGFSYLYLGFLPMIVMHTVGNLFFFPLIINFIERSNLL